MFTQLHQLNGHHHHNVVKKNEKRTEQTRLPYFNAVVIVFDDGNDLGGLKKYCLILDWCAYCLRHQFLI